MKGRRGEGEEGGGMKGEGGRDEGEEGGGKGGSLGKCFSLGVACSLPVGSLLPELHLKVDEGEASIVKHSLGKPLSCAARFLTSSVIAMVLVV